MRIFRTTAAALLLGAGTVPANAATESGDFAVYGWGARDCNAIVTVLGGEQAAQAQGQMAEWISGYISARNRVGDGIYDLTPIKSQYPLVALARNICTNNPDQLFEAVVDAMMTSFEKLALSADSPISQLSRNGRSATVNESTLLKVQQFLIGEGMLEGGSADGKYGPKTASAIEAWQEQAGLTTTGLPDVATLFVIAQQIE
ncbi:peptidoglycan-binding domain-containing protein [Roseovarius ramblicola]|uniref:Peptidoglycan-binding protein n=1 Tax=Roseovarius ramblicola TaxID=2022336 RepID=A0ABV5HX77_9RHOB